MFVSNPMRCESIADSKPLKGIPVHCVRHILASEQCPARVSKKSSRVNVSASNRLSAYASTWGRTASRMSSASEARASRSVWMIPMPGSRPAGLAAVIVRIQTPEPKVVAQNPLGPSSISAPECRSDTSTCANRQLPHKLSSQSP